MFIASIQHFNR